MYRQVCQKSGAIKEYPIGSFDVLVEEGTKYPDILGCGAYPFLIVSEQVVTMWQHHHIHSFTTYPVGVAEVNSKKLKDVPPPQYYRVEIDGRCAIDLEASGLRIVDYEPDCDRYTLERINGPKRFQMVADSWDGSDIFRDTKFYPGVSFCTQSILDLAREYQWTNFRFEPMEGTFDSSSKGIDYRKKRARRL
jgi:hypothetical protein